MFSRLHSGPKAKRATRRPYASSVWDCPSLPKTQSFPANHGDFRDDPCPRSSVCGRLRPPGRQHARSASTKFCPHWQGRRSCVFWCGAWQAADAHSGTMKNPARSSPSLTPATALFTWAPWPRELRKAHMSESCGCTGDHTVRDFDVQLETELRKCCLRLLLATDTNVHRLSVCPVEQESHCKVA